MKTLISTIAVLAASATIANATADTDAIVRNIDAIQASEGQVNAIFAERGVLTAEGCDVRLPLASTLPAAVGLASYVTGDMAEDNATCKLAASDFEAEIDDFLEAQALISSLSGANTAHPFIANLLGTSRAVVASFNEEAANTVSSQDRVQGTYDEARATYDAAIPATAGELNEGEVAYVSPFSAADVALYQRYLAATIVKQARPIGSPDWNAEAWVQFNEARTAFYDEFGRGANLNTVIREFEDVFVDRADELDMDYYDLLDELEAESGF